MPTLALLAALALSATRPVVPAPPDPPRLALAAPELRPPRVLSWRISSGLGIGALGQYQLFAGERSLVDSGIPTGLEEALQGSSAAQALAADARRELTWGAVATGASLVLSLGTLVLPVGMVMLSTSPGLLDTSGLVGLLLVGTGVSLAGLGLAVVGGWLSHAGLKDAFEAVATYNNEVVGARLAASPLPGVPPE